MPRKLHQSRLDMSFKLLRIFPSEAALVGRLHFDFSAEQDDNFTHPAPPRPLVSLAR